MAVRSRYGERAIWKRQLAFLVHGGKAPSNAVSELILATWGDLLAPDDQTCLTLLRIATKVAEEGRP